MKKRKIPNIICPSSNIPIAPVTAKLVRIARATSPKISSTTLAPSIDLPSLVFIFPRFIKLAIEQEIEVSAIARPRKSEVRNENSKERPSQYARTKVTAAPKNPVKIPGFLFFTSFSVSISLKPTMNRSRIRPICPKLVM